MSVSGGEMSAATTTEEPRGGLYAWYMVVLLALIYTTSFIDRTIVALLVTPIKHDFGISDTRMSLLSGLSFALLYVTLGVPFGRLADRYNRAVLCALGAILWSVATAFCGLAHGFGELFLARVLVGVGEASLSPSAYSMIGDSFPRRLLGRALGVYNLGIVCGTGVALVVGGLVIAAVTRSVHLELPLIGHVRPWQATFLFVALPGLVLGVLMLLTVREPARRGVIKNAVGQADRPSFLAVIRYLVARAKVYGSLYAGFSIYALINFGFSAWIPTCLERNFGWTAAEVGQRYGIAMLICGILGAMGGGLLADRMMRSGDRAAYMKVSLYSGIGLLPCFILAPLVGNPALSLGLFALGALFNSSWLGVCGGSIQLIAPNQMRGQALAMMYLFSSGVGYGIGPTLVGAITDRVFHNESLLKFSLALVAAVAIPIALVIFRAVQAPFSREVIEAEARNA